MHLNHLNHFMKPTVATMARQRDPLCILLEPNRALMLTAMQWKICMNTKGIVLSVETVPKRAVKKFCDNAKSCINGCTDSWGAFSSVHSTHTPSIPSPYRIDSSLWSTIGIDFNGSGGPLLQVAHQKCNLPPKPLRAWRRWRKWHNEKDIALCS